MKTSDKIAGSKRWVVKIGSALLTDDGKGLNRSALSGWAEEIAALKDLGHEVVLVSSGAVAEGMSRLGWTQRPVETHLQQAAAAIGQMGLVQAYESQFKKHGFHSAQILVTHEDLRDRRRYLNTRSTLLSLLNLGCIPVVNENDTTATEEIRFGDNDTLAALVANLIDADVLVILTDQDGLFDKDPRQNPDAKLIEEGGACDEELVAFAGGAASSISRGGMRTKVLAAQRAARSGTHTVIANGHADTPILSLAKGHPTGTLLLAPTSGEPARKQWIANQLNPQGSLILDSGAVLAIKEGGRSLLPIGVSRVEGTFKRGDLVLCLDEDGREMGRGLCNYNSKDASLIVGKASKKIEDLLGYSNEPELIHRDNLVIH
ncbi:MAG: glutamate 5-kinase [bacterium]